MGTPPLPDIGDGCLICNGILWQPGKTPSQMWLTVAGVVKSEWWIDIDLPPANGTYLLTQDIPFNPCTWVYHAGGIFARYHIRHDNTFIAVSRDFVADFFEARIPEICVTAAENQISGGLGAPFDGGDAFVYW